MSTYLLEGDRITLSPLDTKILVALLAGQNVGYDIARLCEEDSGESVPVSTGNVYKALAKLEMMLLVVSKDAGNDRDARKKTLYRITSLGKMMLEQKLATYKALINVAEERQATK